MKKDFSKMTDAELTTYIITYAYKRGLLHGMGAVCIGIAVTTVVMNRHEIKDLICNKIQEFKSKNK